MRHTFLLRVVRALLLLEALRTALWISHLLAGLPGRDLVAVILIVLRAAVGTMQLVSFMLLLRVIPAGRRLAIWSLGCSAVLTTIELGWRLTPTNTDPTYRWWLVAGYWGYAAGAIWVLRARRTD